MVWYFCSLTMLAIVSHNLEPGPIEFHFSSECIALHDMIRIKRYFKNDPSKFEAPYVQLEYNENKTGMDRFQDCCKAKATNALLQS